jgi:hypothetical protein
MTQDRVVDRKSAVGHDARALVGKICLDRPMAPQRDTATLAVPFQHRAVLAKNYSLPRDRHLPVYGRDVLQADGPP